MNKVVIIGRLTKDPELKYTPGNGTAVTTITVAVDRRYSKENQKEVDFIPVVIWGKIAESTAQYTAKGKLIAVSGRIQTRSYELEDESKRYVTEIVAEEVQFIEWASSNKSSLNTINQFDSLTQIKEGDLPF